MKPTPQVAFTWCFRAQLFYKLGEIAKGMLRGM